MTSKKSIKISSNGIEFEVESLDELGIGSIWKIWNVATEEVLLVIKREKISRDAVKAICNAYAQGCIKGESNIQLGITKLLNLRT